MYPGAPCRGRAEFFSIASDRKHPLTPVAARSHPPTVGSRTGVCRCLQSAFSRFEMSKPSASAKPAPTAFQEQEPASYELAVEELERLVQAMEAGQLPLDQLLASYQRGAALLKYCRARLQAVEQQVQVIEGGSAQAWGEE